MTAILPVDLAQRLLGPAFALRDDPASLQRMLGRIGIHAPVTASEIQALGWVTDLVTVADEAGGLVRQLAAGTADVQAVASALEQLERLVSLIEGLGAAAPSGFFDGEVMAEIAAELPGFILTQALKQWSPPIVSALRLLGVWESELVKPPQGAPAWRRPVRRDRLRLDQLSQALDPAARVRDRWGWEPGRVDADAIIRDLVDVVRLFGLPARYTAVPDSAAGLVPASRRWERRAAALPLVSAVLEGGRRFVEIGVIVSPIEGAGGDEGVFVGIMSDYPPAGPVQLAGDWVAELSAPVPVGIAIRPDRVELVGTAPADAVELSITSPRTRTLALPLATLEVPGWRLSVTIGAQPDPWAEVRLTTATGEPVHLSFDPSGGSAFLRGLVGGGLDIDLDVELSWSTERGFRIGTAAGLDLAIPLSLRLGPIEIQQIRLALTGGAEGISASAGIVTAALLGPFSATVQGVGAAVDVDLSSGLLPRFAVDLLPPSAVGLAIDAEAVRGGGFLEVADGRYSGALSLDIVKVGIDAIVVVDTQLPGEPDGWALFATLAAAFPGIPLGFGFTLNGVGGLLALNRTMDAEALAAGLRSGVVDSLLFPEDPVGDAAAIIAQIDEYFPLLDGNTVVGPIIQIGWGTPTLITAELGVVISLPDGVIAVMGTVEALLPVPDAPLLTLHMDSLGVIDLGAGTFSLTASLYDSRLLESIDLGGDMAMYLQAGRQPYFLLSVGGFHPGFEPPSVVPASMHDLQRMHAAINIAANVAVTVKAYFAVTSNSVQFGASVNVEASVEVWPATYTAVGWFGFDVLLEFSPFRIVAAMSAGVGIYSGNKELLGVQLAFVLEGPKPWYASGYASFKFFGIKVPFDLEVGSKAVGEPRPVARPRAAVIDALQSPASWSEVAPADGLAAGVTFSALEPDDTGVVWIRPDHHIAARQTVAPLNRRLEIVGQAVPAPGEDLLTVTGADLAGLDVEWELASDWFAPAQFEELSRAARLTRASFEEMTAGVTFGAPGVEIVSDPKTLGTRVTMAYEEGTLEESVRTGAAGFGLRHRASLPAAPLFTITPTAYTVVQAEDGSVAAVAPRDAGGLAIGISQYEAARIRSQAAAADDADAARLVVVPVTSALEPAS